MRCENCKWWDTSSQAASAQEDTTGLCRRKSPREFDQRTGMAIWPYTEDTDWCGEYTGADDKREEG